MQRTVLQSLHVYVCACVCVCVHVSTALEIPCGKTVLMQFMQHGVFLVDVTSKNMLYDYFWHPGPNKKHFILLFSQTRFLKPIRGVMDISLVQLFLHIHFYLVYLYWLSKLIWFRLWFLLYVCVPSVLHCMGVVGFFQWSEYVVVLGTLT